MNSSEEGRQQMRITDAIRNEMSGVNRDDVTEHLSTATLADALEVVFHNVSLHAVTALGMDEHFWPISANAAWTPGPEFTREFDPDSAEWDVASIAVEASTGWYLIDCLRSCLFRIERELEIFDEATSG